MMAYRNCGEEYRCEACHALCGPRGRCSECGAVGGRDRSIALEVSRRAAMEVGCAEPRIVRLHDPDPPTLLTRIFTKGPLHEMAKRWQENVH